VQLIRSPRARRRAKKISTSLAVATCSLLGASPGPCVAEEGTRKWDLDTALQYYDEDERVSDVSANFLARRLFKKGRLILRLAVDSLTGASANGATPAVLPQTFTTPSGRSTYTAGAGETPLDSTFLDTRVALSGTWEQEMGRLSRFAAGMSFSDEYDYFHAGINGRWSRDFNQRNTTLSFGLALSDDTIDPVGGAPLPLAPMLPVGDTSNKAGVDSKTVVDFLFGVTQVLTPRTIAQFNYSLSDSSGYLTDPYKLISVVDSVTGDPAPGPPGVTDLYYFENRPDSRTKHSLYGQIRHHLDRDIVDVSYRFMTDDWGVDSHTIDFHYRWKLGGFYLQPHLRYYTQSAADFYVTVLLDTDPVPTDASAAYRLGELDTYTVGLKFGQPLDGGAEWSLRLEYYNQSGTSPPGVGSLNNFDLFPDVDALIAQVGYRF
jgi:hypothetical protein